MTNKRVKVYTYTRVSTDMQKDGYSLDAQKNRIRQYAEAFDYQIIREYEDAGKSGKAIEGRPEFKMMLEDIESNKDGVSFVIVFKLSRFGRNSLDILNTIQFIQDHNVNLISVEEGIDSSKETGKLLITILSAVSEIERENILAQTMEGRKQKAREGKWNGGFAPYGYKLIEGKLVINDKEAEAIKIIFDKYVNTTMGANGVAKYLEQQGIRKIPRQNGKNPLFSASFIRRILDNEVYYGKITYGKRTKKKKPGTGNEYQTVNQKDYLIADGIHKAIIDEETWIKAQNKRKEQASKYEHINKGKKQKVHLLSGILLCPVCGAGMYGNKSTKYKNGKKYKDYYYYGCKHRKKIRGHACNYSKQIAEPKLDKAVGEIISAAAGKQKFVESIEKKIKIETDTNQMNKKIDNIKKLLDNIFLIKDCLKIR